MFRSLLVANRGEIAVRILTSARAQGLRTIAVYSAADAASLHLDHADEAVFLGDEADGGLPYLDIERLIAAARETGAEAVHPGYGFLAESSDFAAAVEQAGLIWVGPPPEAIDAMGRKDAARELARAAGVPVVPGTEGQSLSDEQLIAAAHEIGVPLLIKASAGGGGRGMRLVRDLTELPAQLDAARREAKGAFGNGDLLIERYLERAHHIEIQVAADAHGHAIALGERECSVQRRHQKVLEEAPSPTLQPEERERMQQAALRLVHALSYRSLGTLEFLFDELTRDFYFMEMNTRIQVEHPVTEMITGVDLVALQLRVAAGERLGLQQSEVRLRGHAVELRLYAEDPDNDFLPQAGEVGLWRGPRPQPGRVRVDSGLKPRDQVSRFYDPMVAKLVCWGEDRDRAFDRMAGALDETRVMGLTTNLPFLRWLVAHPEVRAGHTTTRFLSLHSWPAAAAPAAPLALVGLALARYADGLMRRFRSHARPHVSLWQEGETVWQVALEHRGQGRFGWGVTDEPDNLLTWEPSVPGEVVLRHAALGEAGGRVELVDRVSGRRLELPIATLAHHAHAIGLGRHWWRLTELSLLPEPSSESDGGAGAVAGGAAVVVEVHVEEGQRVAEGDALVSLESMKMITTLRASSAGTVTGVRVAAGDAVDSGALLVAVEEEP